MDRPKPDLTDRSQKQPMSGSRARPEKVSAMATQRLGIIMHGITGRMGCNQHLVRSICAIRDLCGVLLPAGIRVMPDPILVGRNAD